MKNTILITALLFILAACGSGLDKEFDQDNYEAELKEMLDNNEINSQEYLTINMFIGAASATDEDLSDFTYNELLQRGQKMIDKAQNNTPNIEGL